MLGRFKNQGASYGGGCAVKKKDDIQPFLTSIACLLTCIALACDNQMLTCTNTIADDGSSHLGPWYGARLLALAAAACLSAAPAGAASSIALALSAAVVVNEHTVQSQLVLLAGHLCLHKRQPVQPLHHPCRFCSNGMSVLPHSRHTDMLRSMCILEAKPMASK